MSKTTRTDITTITYNGAEWTVKVDPANEGMATFNALLTLDQFVASRARLDGAKGRRRPVYVHTSEDDETIPTHLLSVTLYATADALN